MRKLGVLVAACVLLGLTATPAGAAPFTSGRYTAWGDGRLELRGTGLCLDAALEEIDVEGGRVQLWTCGLGGDEQKWTPVSHGRGTLLVNRLNGKCLDAALEEIDLEGGRVQMWTCGLGGDEQLWTFDSHQGDVFIDSRATNGKLGVGRLDDLHSGAPVGVWHKR
ncbi:RICIN domain-containing protein [Actinosynnema sp. NPDC023587]|uniref:RICIN domain-containing protein n=1 Tax=Actinosynnema sp. NPDC023587 TaxID=3154695 RepID=UPI0033E1C5DE